MMMALFKYSNPIMQRSIKVEIAFFIGNIFEYASPQPQKAFIIAGGLKILNDFLGENLVEDKDLSLISIDSLSNIINNEHSLKIDVLEALINLGTIERLMLVIFEFVRSDGKLEEKYAEKSFKLLQCFADV
jgi:hypothetical protein